MHKGKRYNELVFGVLNTLTPQGFFLSPEILDEAFSHLSGISGIRIISKLRLSSNHSKNPTSNFYLGGSNLSAFYRSYYYYHPALFAELPSSSTGRISSLASTG